MLPHVPSFVLLFPLFAFPLLSQSNTNKKSDYKLTVSVNLVGVLATVTTAEGGLVSGLKSTDFHIYENGQIQERSLFFPRRKTNRCAFACSLTVRPALPRR